MKLTLIQVSRGVAAVLVIMHHLIANCTNHLNYVAYNNFFNFGFLGVDFFFVLSGFIITYMHLADLQNPQPNSVSVFFKKRFIRIYPIYWIIAVLTLLIYMRVTPIYIVEAGIDMGFLSLKTLSFLIQSFLLIPNEHIRLVGVSWSLSYELLFYIIFGCCIILGLKSGKIIACAWALLIVLFSFLSSYTNEYLRFFFDEMILEFLVGCVVGYIIRKNIEFPLNYSIALLVVLVTILFKVFHMDGLVFHRNLYNITLIGLIFSLITYILVIIEKRGFSIKSSSILVLIGDASYSIYLSHNIFLSGLTRAYAKLNPNFLATGYLAIVATIIFLITLLLGVLIHLLIEKKLMRILVAKFIIYRPIAEHKPIL